jgi:hypothetical protein
MIDNVYGGEYLNISSNKGSLPYINTSNPITGTLAYDSSSQSMKVFDGNSFQTLGGGSASVNLTPNAINILKWAEKKMIEEMEYDRLSKTNPTIKSLLDEMNKYKDQIEMVKILMKEEVKV